MASAFGRTNLEGENTYKITGAPENSVLRIVDNKDVEKQVKKSTKNYLNGKKTIRNRDINTEGDDIYFYGGVDSVEIDGEDSTQYYEMWGGYRKSPINKKNQSLLKNGKTIN